MTLAALPPLLWALAGLFAVVRFSGARESRADETPRIRVTCTDDLRPAA
jgi:hypothetical protein